MVKAELFIFKNHQRRQMAFYGSRDGDSGVFTITVSACYKPIHISPLLYKLRLSVHQHFRHPSYNHTVNRFLSCTVPLEYMNSFAFYKVCMVSLIKRVIKDSTE
jgi:hypothetical protein